MSKLVAILQAHRNKNEALNRSKDQTRASFL